MRACKSRFVFIFHLAAVPAKFWVTSLITIYFQLHCGLGEMWANCFFICFNWKEQKNNENSMSIQILYYKMYTSKFQFRIQIENVCALSLHHCLLLRVYQHFSNSCSCVSPKFLLLLFFLLLCRWVFLFTEQPFAQMDEQKVIDQHNASLAVVLPLAETLCQATVEEEAVPAPDLASDQQLCLFTGTNMSPCGCRKYHLAQFLNTVNASQYLIVVQTVRSSVFLWFVVSSFILVFHSVYSVWIFVTFPWYLTR